MLKAPGNVARFWFNYTFASPIRGEPPSSASLLVTVNDTSSMHTERHGPQKASNLHGTTDALSEILVDFELQWWGKAPTREAESLWFSISPLVSAGNSSDADAGWLLDKLGRCAILQSPVVSRL